MLLLLIALVIGISIGFILEKSSLVEPQTVLSQFLLDDFTMLKIYLSAVITSLIIFVGLHYAGVMSLESFSFSYTRAIIAGILIGLGIALTGAIPITIAAQIGVGYRDAIFIALGGLCGSICYHFIREMLHYIDFFELSPYTLSEALGMSYWAIALMLIILLSLALLCLKKIDSKKQNQEDDNH